jgi:hypothetical protein
MPQLDINLFDDFIFFAFVSLLFGFGDDEVEESVIELNGEVALAQYYIGQHKLYMYESNLITNLITASILTKK